MPWYEEAWSKGILLGLDADQNTGYRATIWFEYTRALFNAIREGSLVAVRNFSDRAQSGQDAGGARDAAFEEYSILQIDQVHPWHYAIQGPGERGYPAFTVASAESARRDWTDWDERNRDDVSRIRCEAIPLRLSFRLGTGENQLPSVYPDRSKPMPGFEARLLLPQMTESIINKGLVDEECIEIGSHLVQSEVAVKLSVPELVTLHFGVFGFTGAGKSNLMSTLVRRALLRPPSTEGREAFRFVLFDLMDEYTGLLIDQLAQHQDSRVIVAGRNTFDNSLMEACQEAAACNNITENAKVKQTVLAAATTWAKRITLPAQLRPHRELFIKPLARLICQKKVNFYEPLQTQGQNFNIDLDQLLTFGPQTFGTKQEQTQQVIAEIRGKIESVINEARAAQGVDRDKALRNAIAILQGYVGRAQKNKPQVIGAIDQLRGFVGTRGSLPKVISTWPKKAVELLNAQPPQGTAFSPSLWVVVGENEKEISGFARQLIQTTFEDRRTKSLLYPSVSFAFDEADVFLNQQDDESGVVEEATLLARRGRKFGMGLGIATQRIRYLNTSIMAQPHTYFISKLPRQSDRQAVAEAFAISEASLEQSFGFSTGQWLVASHDATGLKGTPFPVRFPNANDAVAEWLRQYPQNQPGRQ